MKAHLGRRSAAFLLALALEIMLVLVLFTLGHIAPTRRSDGASLSTFTLSPPAAREKATQAAAPSKESVQTPRSENPPPQPDDSKPAEPVPSLIPMSAQDMALSDISRMPARPAPPAPARSTTGPSDNGASGDTPRMAGTGPNGEPLYAAQWYRRPYDNELSGYLATASGPGWGLIACRTVADYRVEDCVAIDEYPQKSNIARAVLAAAWQFRVRPPRRGGRVLIGEWVGIRIDYGIRSIDIR